MSFNLTITLGNVLTVVGFVATAVVVWTKLQDKVEAMAQRLGALEKGLQDQVRTCQRTIQCKESNYLALITEIKVVQNDVTWIKQTLAERKPQHEQE